MDRYDVSQPKSVNNDRFVLSKGHAAPILYAAWAEAGTDVSLMTPVLVVMAFTVILI